MTRASLGYVVLIGVLLGSLTSAEALRCGQRIIALGYTKLELRFCKVKNRQGLP
jgi:hypothetical protein